MVISAAPETTAMLVAMAVTTKTDSGAGFDPHVIDLMFVTRTKGSK